MSTHDPYDFIEWHPEHNQGRMFVLKRKGDNVLARKHAGTKGKQWIGYLYDLITLCTLAAAVATLLNLSLNGR